MAVATIVSALSFSNCGGFVEPATCERDTTTCGGIHDARFCDYVALSVEGNACADLGIAEAKHFCVVNSARCIPASYSFGDRDCRVLRYQTVRDSWRADCPSGAPVFVMR
jgi:hypothetical protein